MSCYLLKIQVDILHIKGYNFKIYFIVVWALIIKATLINNNFYFIRFISQCFKRIIKLLSFKINLCFLITFFQFKCNFNQSLFFIEQYAKLYTKIRMESFIVENNKMYCYGNLRNKRYPLNPDQMSIITGTVCRVTIN